MQPGESLVFPVDLVPADRVEVAGRTWFRRPEFHVTTLIPGELAEVVGVDEDVLLAAGERHRDELTRPRGIAFDGRVAEVRAEDGRHTLVAFCSVDGLEEVFERLDEEVGRPLPRPPTHVTVYTAQPGMAGIGLATSDAVEQRAAMLSDADAREVIALLDNGAP